jgi:hypothetical protein
MTVWPCAAMQRIDPYADALESTTFLTNLLAAQTVSRRMGWSVGQGVPSHTTRPPMTSRGMVRWRALPSGRRRNLHAGPLDRRRPSDGGARRGSRRSRRADCLTATRSSAPSLAACWMGLAFAHTWPARSHLPPKLSRAAFAERSGHATLAYGSAISGTGITSS